MNAARRSPGPALLYCRLLEHKIAIVTWASPGIGAAAAHAFAAAGATVVLAAPNETDLETIATQIARDGGEAIVVPADTRDPVAAERLVHRTLTAFGRLDVAFNNTGQSHLPAPLADLSLADFDNSMRLSTRGCFLLMKHQIPAMLAGGGGAIVNMYSGAEHAGVLDTATCPAAKHAIVGLTETAALNYRKHGIRVNAIAPATIFTQHLSCADKRTWVRIGRNIPLRRLSRPEDAAAAAVWLCSDEASFISGVTIPIDGGRLTAGL